MTNHTIFSSLNQALFDSVTHFSAFGHPKIDVVRVPPPFESPDTPDGGLFSVVVPQTSHKTLSFVNNDPFATKSTHEIFCTLIVEVSNVRARTSKHHPQAQFHPHLIFCVIINGSREEVELKYIPRKYRKCYKMMKNDEKEYVKYPFYYL